MYRLAMGGEIVQDLIFDSFERARRVARALAHFDESGEGVDIIGGELWLATIYRPIRARAH
jgi:hypothetical protein